MSKNLYMRTSTGKKFYPNRPVRSAICIEDIANGLAGCRRYASQGLIDKHYSVAEHSVLMTLWALENDLQLVDPKLPLTILLHDAAEAYIGDLVRAVKQVTGSGYKVMEAKIESVIFHMFGIWDTMCEQQDTVKDIDKAMVPYEIDQLFLPIVSKELPLDLTEYADLGELELYFWDPITAKKEFLEMFTMLGGQDV